MPKRMSWLARLMLIVVIMAGVLTVAVIPTAMTPKAYASSDTYPAQWAAQPKDKFVDPWGEDNRECTSYVAWMLHSVNGFEMPFHDDAVNWGPDARSRGYAVDMNPAPGSVYWTSSPQHVAWVESVNGSSVTIEDYNHDYTGHWDEYSVATSSASGYIHFKDLNGTPTPTPTPTPVITRLLSARSPDGTAIETYAATASRVTQHWYYDGGSSGTANIIDIAQNNIVGIDKINQSDGTTESVYTAVPDGVWESWWNPSSGGVHSAKIVYPGLSGITLSGVRGVIADNTVESGVVVHHLYILASDGPYEAWWKDGGDGLHLGRLAQINGPVSFTHSIGPDGAEQLYVAVPTWVYEVTWVPGGAIAIHNVINVTQGDIRSVVKGDNLSGGGQLLYTTTSTTVWQTYWTTTGGPYSQGTIATGQVNALQGLKVVTPDGAHHVYLATPDHVQEYWWLGSTSGGGELIRISQGNITAISQTLDGSMQLLLTAAGNNVWETWWNSSQSPNSAMLFSVTK